MPSARKSFTSAAPEGQVNPLAGVTFDLDEVTFECQGRMSFLDMSDLARRISDLPTTDLDKLRETDPAAAAVVMGSMSNTLLMALGQAEYQRFRTHCREHATPDETITEVMAFINSAIQDSVEEQAGRPTQPPQPSSTGDAEKADRMSRIVSLQAGDVSIVGEDGELTPVMQGGQPVTRQPAKTEIKTIGGEPATTSRGRRHTG